MIGFEICINDRKPIIAASNQFIYANLAYGYSSEQVVVKGGDESRYLTWFAGKPEKGDRVSIRIIETGDTSPVLTTENRDRNEMKQIYEELKAELLEKGLI